MSTITTKLFIDSYHPKQDGRCAMSLQITYNRKKKYYPILTKDKKRLCLLPSEFTRLLTARRRNENEKEVYNTLQSYESKATGIIEKLNVFTFGSFENLFIQNRGVANSINAAFDTYITELRKEGREGTASSYESAKISLNNYKKDLRFADITKAELTKYESYMTGEGNSMATIGIYLRSLRAIYNSVVTDRTNYPFGAAKGQYKIPTGRNIKKALTLQEIEKIYNHKPAAGTTAEMARDYWLFIYLCNGLNVKDLCLLKRKDIDGDFLTFQRAKTKRTRKDGLKISVALKPEAKAIIAKWEQRSISPESYIFPHLEKGTTPLRERRITQQLIKVINKYMKLIADELEISKNVTTYFARHSFATILKRSGASTEFIKEALGHGDMKTTENYLDSFEKDTLHKTTDALTAFAKTV